MFVLLSMVLALFGATPVAHAATQTPVVAVATDTIPTVPFYSQFKDVSSASWQKRACGIASLAMVIDYYRDSAVSVDALLKEGIAAGAYSSAGWTYQGLINVAQKHGMTGASYDLGALGSTTAFTKLTRALTNGPVIASVHYKFDPKSSIPHLVVLSGIDNDYVYYNDPAAKAGDKKILIADFRKAWKQRYIAIRPAAQLAVAK
ncbi:MAG TPA: C39 family peptidase [Candidatus Paceibacterota bacterium]